MGRNLPSQSGPSQSIDAPSGASLVSIQRPPSCVGRSDSQLPAPETLCAVFFLGGGPASGSVNECPVTGAALHQ